MSGNKSLTLNVSSKVAVIAALGAGVVVGAGTAYLLTRINEHTHLTQQISSLHATILEVKKDLASLETELDKAYSRSDFSSSRPSSFHKKTVSFSSTTTSASYKTAPDYDTDSSKANDTDYYSPDEDEDEFFDLSPEDNKEVISFGEIKDTQAERLSDLSVEEAHLCHLLEQVDILCDGSGDDQTQAYNLLKSEEFQYSRNSEFLWRIAKATRNMATLQEKLGNMKEKETLIFDAYEYAAQALELNKNSAETHKWYAILAGERGGFLGMKERVKSGNIFKEHIDRALDLKPQDATLHHLLGRFCFEVAQLSWLERRAAAALFGEVPSSTYEEALHHFLAAEELGPCGWKENRLFVAKCQIQMNSIMDAAIWLEQAATASVRSPNDEIVQKEVLELQQKYS